MKKINISGFGVFLCILFLNACGTDPEIYFEEYETEKTEVCEQFFESFEETENGRKDEFCYVYLCGAVLKPGVYTLKEGDRIYEAIELAGGLLPEADVTSVNQAETITDGQMIYIYTLGEEKEAEQETEKDSRIDINKADRNMLMTLPGIGEAKADAILSYRESKGGFSTVDELKNIPGIKEGIFEQIKEQIKVSN